MFADVKVWRPVEERVSSSSTLYLTSLKQSLSLVTCSFDKAALPVSSQDPFDNARLQACSSALEIGIQVPMIM